MMIRMYITFMLLMAASYGFAQQVHTDPEGYYKMQVPANWRVETQAGGVSLLKDAAYVSLIRMKGKGAPQSLVEFFAANVGSQWQKFEGASSGDSQFGGRPGAYAWYKGINPRGVEAVLKIVATTDGESGYAMLMSVPRNDFASVKADFEQIEAGFELIK